MCELSARGVREMAGEYGVAPKEAVVAFFEADLFEVDVSSATHMYIASLMFTEAMMGRLRQLVVERCPRLRCVASLQPFPDDGGLGTKHTASVQMSWDSRGTKVYFYYL